ncbi:hypothetical protein L915_12122 [Phytophthora nicotianae]|uniref:Uncharacterized protein n=1 Tax=Phytophthora nicotianae TaxID=4792 RepID=W2GJQ4_PHYNI|nr:hypothetical protein L915_12122 [Phytophthora nicotianae]
MLTQILKLSARWQAAREEEWRAPVPAPGRPHHAPAQAMNRLHTRVKTTMKLVTTLKQMIKKKLQTTLKLPTIS